jgi:hypothetical protein
MGSNIKGGGRAVMSQESQEVLIDLLLSIDREDNGGDWPDFADLSIHDQKRTRKQFVKKLVRKYERKQVQQRYNSAAAAPSTCQGVSTMDRSHQPLQASQISSGGTNPKVRIELAEAVFANEKELSKKKTGDDKGTPRRRDLVMNSKSERRK